MAAPLISTVLLLEDEAIIAFDMEDMLLAAGAQQVVWLDSAAKALEWLLENTPDAVVVDPRLKDGPCSTVVRQLVERSIPFVVFSGDVGAAVDDDEAFAKGVPLDKPSRPDQVEWALAEAFARL